MTPPRIVLHGKIIFFSIRCVKRTFQLVPKREVVRHLNYAMAAIGQKYSGRIHLHGWMFMSNHIHILLTDVGACYPMFVQELDSLLARNLNALRGQGGAVFEEGYGAQVLLSDREVLRKLIYMYGNPVRANLVAKARHWKGCTSLGVHFGQVHRASRPKTGIWKGKWVHTRRRGSKRSRRAEYACRTKFPEEAKVPLVRPAIMLDLDDEQLYQRVLEGLDAYELQCASDRIAHGKSVLGWRRVVKQHYMATPPPEELFTRNPKFSGGDQKKRRSALAWYKEFLSRYRAALQAYRDGDRTAAFPQGTYQMLHQHGVPCCPMPDF